MSSPVPRKRLSVALLLVMTSLSLQAETAADADADAVSADERDARVLDEAISVTAKGTAADVPTALATRVVQWQEEVAAPSDFQDLITRLPGIGATGQNGIFETFSIRGSGGNGILVVFGGMPLTAQRRAGVPVSFVEPALLGDINVTLGPATVHFGPGALGGAISIEPRWFEGSSLMAGYADSGDEYSLMAGTGNETFSIGIARHEADDNRSANGTPLNNSYERDSLTLQTRHEFGDWTFDALLLPSRTDNIGKSNSRFPTRDTTYPEDDHTVGRLRLKHVSDFVLSVHGHDQSLLTYNQRPGVADTFAFVESLDLGATAQQTWHRGDFSYNLGLELLNRRNVNAFDVSGSLNGNRRFSLRDAEEDNWSMFAIADWQASEQFALEFGARFSKIEQEQGGAGSDDDDVGFSAGGVWTPDESHRISLSLASGYRFATLEERFFTGVTPQGEIVGNPDLSSESSLGLDLGHVWQSGAWVTELHLWRTEVDDLIQLFAISQGVNGYTNVADATLHGIDGSVGWLPTENLELRTSLTLVRSKDERTGNPLFGSPPLTAALEAKYQLSDAFEVGAYLSHRWRMKRPGFEEVARDAVSLVDLDLTWHASAQLDVQLYARNAFDEDYVATADVLSALGPERSIGLNLVWNAQ